MTKGKNTDGPPPPQNPFFLFSYITLQTLVFESCVLLVEEEQNEQI